MARIEIDGIYKHAPLTNAQLNSVTRRNLDREIVIKRDAVTDRATLIPNVTTPATDAGAYPVNYIYAMNYDTTDDGGVNPNIRRHIPTLEFLGNSAVDTAGSNWINVETGTYNYVTSGSTLQTAVEQLDSKLASNTLKYIIDGSTNGSLVSSTDGTTSASINVGQEYQIALGYNQYITSSYESSILGGERHYIYAQNSAIVSGLNNRLMYGANYSIIGGGVGNLVNGAGGEGYTLQFPAASLTQTSGTATLVTYSKHGYTGSISASVINVTEPDYAVSGVTMTVIDEYTLTFSISPSAPASATPSTTWNSYGIQLLITTGNSGAFAFIGAGTNNYILSTSSSSIVGGVRNIISSVDCFIGGGYSNSIYNSSNYSSIVCGYYNAVQDGSQFSFIGAGYGNYISGSTTHAFIGGGYNNYVGEFSSHGSIVNGYQNRITSMSPYAFIGGGQGNYIHSSDWGAIVGGSTNYITQASDYSSILGGYSNYIGQSSTYATILGGRGNYISSSGLCGFIGAGESNYIIEGSAHSAIVGGYINYIKNGSSYCFIGGGNINVIQQGSTYCAILGGNSNTLGANSTLESSFIIGSSINISSATSYQFNNTTYMNNVTLWNRGLVLKDRTGNQGDALIIESIDSNGMPLVTWGSVSGSGSYSGTDPISGSTGMYTAASKGSSTLVTTNSYIVVENAENTAGNSVAMVGTAFDPVGYNFTNVSATTYGTIIADMLNVSSAGLVIEAGYRYQIDVDSIALTWGKNTSINRPKLTVSYKPAIIFSTTNYTFGPNSGAVTGDLVLSDSTSGNYDFTSTDANATCPHLMLSYNSTAKKINFVLKDIYASSLYVYKLPATYTSILSGSTMDITWNPDLYPLPTTSDLLTFWNSDPATNGGNPGVTISSVVGNTVTININYGPHTNEPCWVYVKGRLPVMSVILKYTITKTTI